LTIDILRSSIDVFCEPGGFDGYCSENSLTRDEGFKQLRAEFHFLRNGRLIDLVHKADNHLPDLPLLETAP